MKLWQECLKGLGALVIGVTICATWLGWMEILTKIPPFLIFLSKISHGNQDIACEIFFIFAFLMTIVSLTGFIKVCKYGKSKDEK